jgi:integrase
MKLTQKTIAALELPAGKTEAIIFDTELAGFGLRLRPSGRTWIYQYRFGAKQRRLTLGSLVAVTPARAREIANELHAKVRLGIDPSAEKSAAKIRSAETMGAALESYLGFQRARLRPRSMIEVERHLLKYCKPLHAIQLTEINRRLVATRITAVTNKHGASAANQVRASLSAFFSWAIRQGMADANPVVGTTKHAEKSRDRVLSDAELKRIWDALGSDHYSAIVRLLMLTGQRANEIGSLCWSEIVDNTIVLPPARTKNKHEHVVPLAPMAQDILARANRDSDFVFGRRRRVPFRGWGVCKEALDRRIGEIAHWVHHDLRRTMATRMAEMGTQPHIIEAILNHVSGHKRGVAGIYNRATYEPQKRIALQKWADHVALAVSGRQPAKVVSLRGA